jgi:hypothetical protein
MILVMQYFLNMEIERYTLATGETALTGCGRYRRHWGRRWSTWPLAKRRC